MKCNKGSKSKKASSNKERNKVAYALDPGLYRFYVTLAGIRGESYDHAFYRSIKHPEEYWAEVSESVVWTKPWDKVLDDSNSPFTKWFANVSIFGEKVNWQGDTHKCSKVKQRPHIYTL